MSMQVASKSDEAIVVCEAPDVCWTPMGGSMVAVPYMIIGRLDRAEGTASKYLVNGLPAFTMASRIPTVEGDEAGTGGGLISGVNCGYCRPIEHSATFKAEGHYLVREGDLVAMNCAGPDGLANTYGRIVIQNKIASAAGVSLKKASTVSIDPDTGETLTEERAVLRDPVTGAVTEVEQRSVMDPRTGEVRTERFAVTTQPNGARKYEAAVGRFDPATKTYEWKATTGAMPDEVDLAGKTFSVDDDAQLYLGSDGERERFTPPPAGDEPDIADDDPKLLADPELKAALEEQAAVAEEQAALERQAMWEGGKMGADIAGIFDPTPASDLIGGAMCVVDGDWVGAGLSLVSIVPYFGDAIAKPFKGTRAAARMAKLMDKVRKVQGKTAALAEAAKKAKERAKALIKKRRARQAAGMPEVPRPKKVADGGHTPKLAPKRAVLRNAEHAKIDPRKIFDYALNTEHAVGGNKAKVFESALGYNRSNGDELIAKLREGLRHSEPIPGKVDQHGSRFTVDVPMTGPNGKQAVVRTGWIYKPGSDTPELTTLFAK
jgi:hypothetical protein